MNKENNHRLISTIKDILNKNYNLEVCREQASLIGQGIDFLVIHLHSKKLGDIAVRTPKMRHINYGNETYDLLYFLKKEKKIYKYCQNFDFPVPKFYFIHESDDIIFFVYEYVINDRTNIPPNQLAHILNKLHSLPIEQLSDIRINEHENTNFNLMLASRIQDRTQKLNYINPIFPTLDKNILIKFINHGDRRSLLHMDIRPDNILTRDNKIVSIIDWSYAIIGDPLLEVIRIEEFSIANGYSLFDHSFLDHYNIHSYADISDITELIYRLDAALMITLVFTENPRFKNLLNRQLDRTFRFLKELKSMV